MRGFTLGELLVVITMIGLLFIIVAPSFDGISGQTKLDAAANAVQSASQYARQYALSRGQPAYLVFHDAQSTTDPELAYRSFSVFTIDTHHEDVVQSNGYFITNWEILPAGIVFDAVSDPENNIFEPDSGHGWNGALSENNVLRIDTNSFVVAGFSPSGKTSTLHYWDRRCWLTEGFYEGDTLQRTSNQGKEIRIDLQGKSRIIDTLYNDSGEPEPIE
jgi:type II secretory pathway pseudopilin PulG